MISKIKKIFKKERAVDPDEIQRDGYWFRIQEKADASYNSAMPVSKSTNSIRAFKTLPQTIYSSGFCDFDNELIIVKYNGNVKDKKTTEGFLIPSESPVVARFDYINLVKEYNKTFS